MAGERKNFLLLWFEMHVMTMDLQQGKEEQYAFFTLFIYAV